MFHKSLLKMIFCNTIIVFILISPYFALSQFKIKEIIVSEHLLVKVLLMKIFVKFCKFIEKKADLKQQ